MDKESLKEIVQGIYSDFEREYERIWDDRMIISRKYNFVGLDGGQGFERKIRDERRRLFKRLEQVLGNSRLEDFGLKTDLEINTGFFTVVDIEEE